jgi:hypothetical protein
LSLLLIATPSLRGGGGGGGGGPPPPQSKSEIVSQQELKMRRTSSTWAFKVKWVGIVGTASNKQVWNLLLLFYGDLGVFVADETRSSPLLHSYPLRGCMAQFADRCDTGWTNYTVA